MRPPTPYSSPLNPTRCSPLRRFWAILGVASGLLAATAPTAHAEVRFHGEANGHYRISVMSWAEIPFRSTIRQQYDYSCGSAAVATLLRHHYGVQVNEADAFKSMFDRGDQARIREVGFSMLDMKSYLEEQGFQADGFRMSLDRLAQMQIPGIALIVRDGYRHFVVIKGVRGDQVLLGDPTFGLRVMQRSEFEGMWNGVVLAIRKSAGEGNPFGFNREAEWTPWSSAPTAEAARETQALAPVLIDQMMMYQVRPFTDGTFLGQ